jgi:hypothetical protein
LSITLPGQDAPAVGIELPEHAWGRPRGTSEQRWFYRMYGAEAALRPPVRWERRAGTLRSSLATPTEVHIETTVMIQEDGLRMIHRLENHGDTDYEQVQAPTCIKLYRPFTDVFLERTYVHHPDGLELLASESPERFRMNAEEWLPVRYVVRCAPPAVTPERRVERPRDERDRVVRRHKLRLADAPFIATASSPPGWVAASHTLETPSIFTNPARTCHHVDPAAPLAPGGAASLALKLYLIKGSAAEAWRLVSRSRARGDV